VINKRENHFLMTQNLFT